ncbi:MAG: TrkH family potassium uptake protein [Candidatus Excrementavichristensenella sp.]|jgi:trk system potassium uptake protein TrkH
MNVRLVFNLLGKALGIEGILMLPSVLVALVYGGGDWDGLLIAAAVAASAGFLLSFMVKPRNENLRAREGLAVVALIWLTMSLFGALPFYIEREIPRYVDCFFECVSGFTTTGSTILTDVEALPKGLLFWRSFTHWVGGMGVLVLSLALLPHVGAGAHHLLKAESPGPSPGKLMPRIGKSSRTLYWLYMGLSLLMFLILMACGMDWYDALIHMFGAAGTGGFSNYNMSVGHFASPAIDFVIGTFMLLFGINFSLYFLLFRGKFRQALRSEEMWVYLGIVGISVLLISLAIFPGLGDWWEALRQGYFQVASIITTTGYATVDFHLWPQFARCLLALLMLLGACAGSTGGGIKIVRVTVLGKSVAREIKRCIRPRSVVTVKMDGNALEEETIGQIQVFFFAYLLVIALAALVVSLDGFSLEVNLTAALATLSNVGPGLGMIGPTGNFSGFSHLSKVVLSLCMLIGRLEIYPILILLAPSSWRKN